LASESSKSSDSAEAKKEALKAREEPVLTLAYLLALLLEQAYLSA
jgi:hypothetical protein